MWAAGAGRRFQWQRVLRSPGPLGRSGMHAATASHLTASTPHSHPSNSTHTATHYTAPTKPLATSTQSQHPPSGSTTSTHLLQVVVRSDCRCSGVGEGSLTAGKHAGCPSGRWVLRCPVRTASARGGSPGSSECRLLWCRALAGDHCLLSLAVAVAVPAGGAAESAHCAPPAALLLQAVAVAAGSGKAGALGGGAIHCGVAAVSRQHGTAGGLCAGIGPVRC